MTINVSLVLGHLLLVGASYVVPWLVYRYWLRPNYRWSQKGNVCYDHAQGFAIAWAIFILVVSGLLYHADLNIIW